MGLSQAISADLNNPYDDNVERVTDFASVKLTPPLVLAISLMFIIASDGHVDDAESSQIQSVIGQNDDLVRFASAYVRSVSLKEFLSRAPHGLSQRDRICILSNVCDAMHADGTVLEIEQKTFQLLLVAFGVSKREFARHTQTLTQKNDRSVLGDFRLAAAHASMTPHLALAASVLYMMSADGSIDKHEIGRLETLVAEYEGLQKLAVAYVKQTKRERFIQEAAYALTDAQKTFILLNVYDTMTSDGVVAVVEDKIFTSLQSTFGIDQAEFAPHIQVLEDKNLKPFDLMKVNVDQLFDLMEADEALLHAAADESVNASLGEMVSRTMLDNVANVKQDLGTSANVVQIQTNAMDALNLQKMDAANDALHREQLADELGDANRQKLDTADDAQHRERLGDEALVDGRVQLPETETDLNRQRLASDGIEKNKQILTPEIRIDHLHEDIEALHGQLTEFEAKNRGWLNVGKIFQQEEEANRQKLLDEDDLRNRQKIEQDATVENFQKLGENASQINRQKIVSDGRLSTTFGSSAVEASEQTNLASVGLEGSAAMQILPVDGQHGDAMLHVPQTQQAPQAQQVLHARQGRGFFHRSRVLDFPESRYKVTLKELLLAIVLTVCVSNLGAVKQGPRPSNMGSLQKLEPTATQQESNAVLSVGP